MPHDLDSGEQVTIHTRHTTSALLSTSDVPKQGGESPFMTLNSRPISARQEESFDFPAALCHAAIM